MGGCGRTVLICVLVISLLAAGFALYTAFRQEPPTNVHYVPLSWPEADDVGKKILFTAIPAANGLSFKAGALACSPTTVEDGKDVVCGNRLYRYERTATSHRLIGVGFRIGTPYVLGSGMDADLPFRGPGIGTRHVRLWPLPSAKEHQPPCKADPQMVLCLENLGASASVAVYDTNGSRHPARGEATALAENGELWIGYVPFRVTRDGKELRLTVPAGRNAVGWISDRGDRRWQDLELPTWSFARRQQQGRDVAEIQTFYPEAVRYRMRRGGGKGHLSDDRVEVQQEEIVQSLIDHELLCLDRDTAGSTTLPRLRWKDPSHPGCNGADLSTNLALAVPPKVERHFRFAQTDRAIGRIVEMAAQRIARNEFVDDPSELPLIFDYRFKVGPGGLQRTPVTLIGIRPGASFHRARPPKNAFTTRPDIRFATGSDSPRLEVEDSAPTGPTPTPGTMLLLAPGDNDSQYSAVVCVGGRIPPTARVWPSATAPRVLPLGSAWFAGTNTGWSATSAPVPNLPCAVFDVRRTPAGESRVTVTPRGATVMRNQLPAAAVTTLTADDVLTIGTIRFVFRAGEELAATTGQGTRGPQRLYPAGRDALQLIGYGSRTSGLEGSMTPALTSEAQREWSVSQQPIRLTVRADLQHIVARELNAAVDTVIAGAQASSDAFRRQRASAITGSAVLMNAQGEVLAVGNAPTANMDDPAVLGQTLMESERRHGEGRAAAEQHVLNHAFRRALPVGSTHKIATSLALLRENVLQSGGATHSCTKSVNGFWIRHGAKTVLVPLQHYSCHDDHALALPVGSLASWKNAFRESCDVYFGLATFGLIPQYRWALGPPGALGSPPRPGLYSGGRIVFDRADPAQLLRPGAWNAPVGGDGNAYMETLLLLGFRYKSGFIGPGRNEQQDPDYDGIAYPTALHPWLPGVAPGEGFTYPTLAGPAGYSNRYITRGVQDGPPRPIQIDGKQFQVKTEHQWIEYLMTGWGQSMTGSALSIATSALPVVNDGAHMPVPSIITQRTLPSPPSPLPEFVPAGRVQHTQATMRDAMRSVVQSGTARLYFSNSSVRPMVGGKTGTIQIEASEPAYEGAPDPDALRRVFRHSCGVLDSGAADADWQKLLGEYVRVMERPSGWSPSLPPWGFAEETADCFQSFNPGLPRIAQKGAAIPSLSSWSEFMKQERAAGGVETVVSSAFVAAAFEPLLAVPATTPPTQWSRQQRSELGEGWVLSVIIEDQVLSPANPTTAKTVSVSILESLQRYLESRYAHVHPN